jgi:surface protein
LDNTPRGGTPIGPTTPRALQYTVDTSLGDGTTTVYNPELFSNTSFTTTGTTDNVYQIDWGDGTRQLLYFADSPSFSFTTHTYSSGGTYTISILVNNDTPWRAFRYLGYLPVLDKVTAITDWGNQFGQIASPFRFSVFDQSNFTSVPGNLDTTNIGARGTEAAFAQTSFTGDVTNFVNLNGSVNSMFASSDFNQDISGWDVSNITDMTSLFALTPFNQNISGWTTSGVTKMNSMFGGNEVFNQPIGSWDVSNVTTMNNMFSVGPTQSSAFNQPLNTWDTSSVTTMEIMFLNATSFNQPLNNWDTSNVLDMNNMFNGATSFNQSLADWDISSISTTPGNNSMENMLDNCGMSSVNYDATLIGWEGQASTPSGVTLGAQGLRYTLGGAAEAARTSLITTYGWTINGDTGV